MAQSNWEADKMLDVYIHDYLTKRNLQNSAKAFFAEGKVSSDPVAIDAPGGFLFEWWSVFWDIFIARTNEKHSEVAAAYIETQQMKAREQQQQSHNQQQQQAFHQMQLLRQQQLAQAQAQAQSRPTEALLRQATPTANVMAAKLYEEKLKQDEPALKRFGDGSLDSNQAAVKATGTAGQPSGPAAVTNPVQMRPQLTIQDNKGDVALLNQRSPATDPALFNMKGTMLSPGVNQTTNLLSSKNWSPLAGMDHRLMQQKAFMQSSSTAYQQLHALTPHQQQILFQAQGNMAPQNTMPQQGSMLQQGNIPADVDARRFKILNNRKDGQPNISTDPSPMQGVSSPLTRATSQDQELLLKMKALHQQQANKLNVQNNQDISSYRSSDQIYSGIEPCPSNNSTGTAKTGTRSQNGKKRKQTASSGPANSTGTGNNSPSSPSTHTTGDVNGATHQNGSMSKALMLMYGSEAHSQLHDLDRLEDGLDDNVESFLSHEENDSRDGLFSGKRSPNLNVSKGFTFSEVGCIRASTNKVVCCHFSSDGNLLASAGHEKKAVLWSMDTLTLRSTLEEHSFLITDVRFSPNSTRLATSSFDKTVRVWDADNPSYSLRTLTGHQTSVMSLDFHPTTEDLLCSCDGDSEIRYWSVSQGICTKVFKGGMTQMRFQPRHGRLLAAASENVVSIFDVDGEKCKYSLQRHTKPVHSVCWDATGEYLASVSEDSVRVWTLRSSVGEGECVHELSSNGNKFHSCVFHPTYPYLLIIGCYESLELWNMKENKSMTIPAHHGLIAALAQSPATGMVASASHDKCVKLWR